MGRLGAVVQMTHYLLIRHATVRRVQLVLLAVKLRVALLAVVTSNRCLPWALSAVSLILLHYV